MSDQKHALIVGAGIGGLTASLALARAGWRATLIERRHLAEDIGAGLQIPPNASAILRDLDVLPRLAASALAPKAIDVRRGRDGATLASLPLEHAGRRWGAPYLLAHRGDLHRALIEAVAEEPAIKLHAECALAGFTANADGVMATAARGAERTTYAVDCLIGADGVRSFVRERWTAMHGRGPDLQDKAQHVAWRALVKSEKVARELRQPVSTIWLGPGAHVVHYPLRGGRLTNVVALLDDPVHIDWAADIWTQSGDPSLIGARFAGWDGRIRELIAAAEEWRLWPLVERDQAWASGRVVLIGDAAHPILPFLGQGAAQAIEDAAALAQALKIGSEVAPALAAFATGRAPRVARVQRESRGQARIYHATGPAAVLRDLAILALGGRLIGRYDWLYEANALQ